MGTNIIITLLMTIFSIGFPLQVLAQEQQAPRSGFSPYVFVTLSSEGERNIPHQNLFGAPLYAPVGEVHVNQPFYIGVQLPPLLARLKKNLSTDYEVDLTIFRPDGAEFLQKKNYHKSKEPILTKQVNVTIQPMLKLVFDANQTRGRYRVQAIVRDLLGGREEAASWEFELKP
jgi:hypothetical protein